MSFPFQDLLHKKFPTVFRAPVPPGMQRIGNYEPEDIFIIGFPKSGHTWMQNLIANALFLNENEPGILKPARMIPDTHQAQFYKRVHSPMFFKAHSLPQREFKRVIYLLRDGRDVMVSYWHFLEASQNRPVDFLHTVKTGEGFFPPCKWHEHIQQWLANPYKAKLLMVRYDDLKRDGVAELKRVFEFAGIQRTQAQLEHAVTQSSFAKMQQREKTQGREDPNWPKDKLFVRRGEVGSYRDEMPPEVLEAFMAEAAPMMRQLGYIDK